MENLDYELKVAQTAIYPEAGTGSERALSYVVLGLVGEAGEIANKFKKIIRGDKPLDNATRMDLADELGDVMWYVARLACEVGVSLDYLQEANAAKLADRQSRGVIKGSGDKR